MKNIIIILIVLVILGIVAFVFLGLASQDEKPAQAPPIEKPVIEAPRAALPEILYNLTGEIQSVGSDSLVFEAAIPEIDENENFSSRIEERKALFTPSTRVTRLTFILQEGTNTRRPQETEATIQDLHIGDMIEVISNRDVKTQEEIEAIHIRILPR